MPPLPLTLDFNPDPVVTVLPLFDGHQCLVIDNALRSPQHWVTRACQQRAGFEPSGHAYPGLEMWLSEAEAAPFVDLFTTHIRARLGARRTLSAAQRLSLVTTAPDDLWPRQRLCHRDNPGLPAEQCMVASVIYLFEDPALGGTSFFRPRRPPAQMARLTQDARLLDAAGFAQRYPELGRGYMVDGNDWFERMATVPARWNRAVFYDGGLYHSGDIRWPQCLNDDPASGRLTVNGFMLCRRNAGQ